jgi:hypothetical protein
MDKPGVLLPFLVPGDSRIRSIIGPTGTVSANFVPNP